MEPYPPYETLTPREKEVFEGVCKGLAAKEIGIALGISPRTVEHHRENIGRKLRTSLLTEWTVIALRSGVRGLEVNVKKEIQG